MGLGDWWGGGRGGGEVGAVGGAEEGLILEVLADAGEILEDFDGFLAKFGGGADAGDHEELGGLESAC